MEPSWSMGSGNPFLDFQGSGALANAPSQACHFVLSEAACILTGSSSSSSKAELAAGNGTCTVAG